MRKITLVVLCCLPLVCVAQSVDALKYLPLALGILAFSFIVACMNVMGWIGAASANVRNMRRLLWINTILDIPVLFIWLRIAIDVYSRAKEKIEYYAAEKGEYAEYYAATLSFRDKYGDVMIDVIIVLMVCGAIAANILLIRKKQKRTEQ